MEQGDLLSCLFGAPGDSPKVVLAASTISECFHFIILARKLAESVPDNLRAIREDLEEGFRSVLKNGLDKLDLVTREEFEVQEAVLAKTRDKLEALEARLKELEDS